MWRSLDWLISRLLALTEWLYGRRAAGIDLAMSALAGGWCALLVGKPALFDGERFAGFQWLPDGGWISLTGFLAALHGFGLVCPAWRHLRTGASLGSAWLWTFVAFSLARVEINTGVIIYGIVGVGMIFAAIFVAGLADERT